MAGMNVFMIDLRETLWSLLRSRNKGTGQTKPGDPALSGEEVGQVAPLWRDASEHGVIVLFLQQPSIKLGPTFGWNQSLGLTFTFCDEAIDPLI